MLLEFLNMVRNDLKMTLSVKCIVGSLNCISATVVWSGDIVGGGGD